MSDKTPLERDLEHYERSSVPFSIYVLILLLILCIGALGIYATNLQKRLDEQTGEMLLMQEGHRTEMVELLKRIKKLEHQPEQPEAVQ